MENENWKEEKTKKCKRCHKSITTHEYNASGGYCEKCYNEAYVDFAEDNNGTY